MVSVMYEKKKNSSKAFLYVRSDLFLSVCFSHKQEFIWEHLLHSDHGTLHTPSCSQSTVRETYKCTV